MSSSPSSLGRIVARASVVGVGAWLAIRHVRLAVENEIALDEMQYAHGGWLLGRGEMIYRDFFEHHQPLLHQVLAALWGFLEDDPTHVLTLRLLLLPVFALAIVAATSLNRDLAGPRAAWVTPPLLLMCTPLSGMAIQIRPDVLGAALFLVALAALARGRRGRPVLWAFVAGFAAAASLGATLKLVVYGLVFPVALIVDVEAARRRADGPRLLVRPSAFVGGAGAFVIPLVLWLAARGSLAAYWSWGVEFNVRHQQVYPGTGWMRNALQIFERSPWLPILAAFGILATWRALRSGSGDRDLDWLVLGAIPTTAASFTWQTAPYLYSAIPLLLILGLFAARGVAAVVGRLDTEIRGGSGPGPLFAVVLIVLLGVGEVRQSLVGLERVGERTNDRQLETLGRLGQLTTPDDPVFHLWGGQIARPSPHFFHFIEAATKKIEAERLRREVVPAMIESGTTVYLHHPLFERLPVEIRSYLVSRFLPLDEDLWIYGERFVPEDGVAQGTFDVVRDGEYFVWPPTAVAEAATLSVGPAAVTSPIFRLERGRVPVRYEGPEPELFLVWLPRDGQPFPPRPELRPIIEGAGSARSPWD